MKLSEFCTTTKLRLVVESTDMSWRCYFPDVRFADRSGRTAVISIIVGAGPTQDRMRADFAQKIRGKVALVYDGLGAYTEYPVPVSLTA